jgi:hypothetical protein
MTKHLTKNEIAAKNGRTLWLHQVRDITEKMDAKHIIKDSSNAKLGEEVVRGPWRGPIKTVTFEERASCPTSCGHWLTCYGRNMRNATRYATSTAKQRDAVILQMEKDLTHWQADIDRKNARNLKKLDKINAGRAEQALPAIIPEPLVFIVRLHVLGDFFSLEYVAKWREWLKMFPSLRVWGYSARLPGQDEIGDALLALREETGGTDARKGAKFVIRFSGSVEHGPGAISEDHPMAADLADAGQAFVCPEQSQGKERAEGPNAIKCGSCAICWQSTKPVIFLNH